MNLIEIANQLKDVPDQMLLKEVQSPSGAYPAYLVVTEMGRRKRMREQAQKEAPTTTVAQDLAEPNREQMMQAMAQLQAQKSAEEAAMPPGMEVPQMPMPRQAHQMSQLPARLNAPRMSSPSAAPAAGLMAMPQAAGELAGQDVLAAQQPRRMAAGGMVAFAKGGDIHYDDRGAIRFQNQGAVPSQYGMRFEDLPEYRNPPAGSVGELFSNMFSSSGQRVDPVTGEPISFGEFLRRQELEQTKAAAPVAQAIVDNTARANPAVAVELARTNPQRAAELASRDPLVAQHLKNAQMNLFQPTSASGPAQAAPAPAPAAPANLPLPELPASLRNFQGTGLKINPVTVTPYVDPYADLTRKNMEAFRNYKEPTAQEITAAKTAAETAYGQKNPFRYGFLEQDIAKREGEMKGRKDSNINEALMQAGLGIMGSKSPRFLQAVSEGGLSALGAYKQGLKDIREGEKDILQSKTALANAQSLYDQGKYNAGEKAEEKAYQQYDRGMSRLNTESAILARNQSAALGIGQLNQQGQLTAAQINQAGQIAQATHGLNAIRTQAELAKLPYELRESAARAQYYTQRPTAGMASDADQKAAEEAARVRAMMSGKPFGSPEYQSLYNQYYSEELQRRAAGVNYRPGGAGSGQPPFTGGGTLPSGWSVQVK